VRAAGGVAAVLNARHEVAKTKGWKDAPPDAATFARAVAREPNLIRRPIVVAGKRVIVGLDRPAYEELG
jgi:arsenate reductase-like glutaredoxin family protein